MTSRTLLAIAVLAALAACGRKEAAPTAPVDAAQQTAPATPAESPPQAAPVTFDQTLELGGISFRVVAVGDGSVRSLTITPSGLEGDNTPVTRETDGAVTGAEIGDLNADGSPEIYVYTNSAGSGSYGSLVAYAANNRKSLSEIYLPPVTDDAAAGKGYMGHDEFTLGEGALLRRFPVYKEGDTNAQATGGSRQLQYELEAGEAGWVLRLDKFAEF